MSNRIEKYKNIRAEFIEIHNSKNESAQLCTYGARIVSLNVLDINKKFVDIIVGPNTLKDFIDTEEKFFGAVVGRNTNRIENGIYKLNRKLYQLPITLAPHNLHSAHYGLHNIVWTIVEQKKNLVQLSANINDMQDGFPGKFTITVTYKFNNKNQFVFEYTAHSTKDTICNITVHPYFNLNGNGLQNVLKHKFKFFAPYYCEQKLNQIPSGKYLPTKNSIFDFSNFYTLNEKYKQNDIGLKNTKGFDHHFVTKKRKTNKLKPIASVQNSENRVQLNIFSTEVGFQFYTGNFLSNKLSVKGKQKLEPFSAFCIEPQFPPNAINIKGFPKPLLKANERYKSITIFEFSNF